MQVRKTSYEIDTRLMSEDELLRRKVYLSEIQQRMNTPRGGLSPLLSNRIELCEGRGVIGWERLPNELPIRVWERYPTEKAIIASDVLAKCFGYDQAFFELYEVASGGPGFAFFTWILQFIVSYAAEKGLDYLISKLKSDEVQKQAKIIALEFGDGNNNGEVVIRIRMDNDKYNTIHIPQYPESINEINKETIDALKRELLESTSTKYTYDRQGHEFAQEDIVGRFISEEM